jgi:hypothetical protein
MAPWLKEISMLSSMVLINYIVAGIVIFGSLAALKKMNGRSILAIISLGFVTMHMLGVYWVPAEIEFYAEFNEILFNRMLFYHIIVAILLMGGCLLQPLLGSVSTIESKGIIISIIILFTLSLVLTSPPVAVFVAGCFLLRLGDDNRLYTPGKPQNPGDIISILVESKLILIIILILASVALYIVIASENFQLVIAFLRSGFASVSQYSRFRVGVDFIPTRSWALISTIIESIIPAFSLLLLSAFLYKRTLALASILIVVIGFCIATKTLSLMKSNLAIYAIQLVMTYFFVSLFKSKSYGKGKIVRHFLRLSVGITACLTILVVMYHLSKYAGNLIESISLIISRTFIIPSTSAYAWFEVFPAGKGFLGFSQSHILSFIFGVPFARAGYLPYEVAVLHTGWMFGLNANFMATAWANFGAWGLIVVFQLIIGTLIIDKWGQAIKDPYVYVPMYAYVLGVMALGGSMPFEALVVNYGVWIVPVIFCLFAKIGVSPWLRKC